MEKSRKIQDAEFKILAWIKESRVKAGARLPSERALEKTLDIEHYSMNRAMSRLISNGVVRRDGYRLFLEKSAPEGVGEFSCDLVVSRQSKNIPGYRRLAKEMGFPLQIHTWTSTGEAISILNHLNPPEVRCVVFDPPAVHSSSTWESAAFQLTGRGVPLVVVGQALKGLSAVLGDHYRAVRLAVDHLLEQGHTQLALMSKNPHSVSKADILDAWKQVCQYHRLDTSMYRIKFQSKARLLRSDAVEIARLFDGDWKNVTALVVSIGLDNFVPELLKEFERRNRRIPQDLSLICIGDAATLRDCQPPITVVDFDMAIIQEIAFQFAKRAVRKIDLHAFLPPPSCTRVQPELVPRGSTASIAPTLGEVDKASKKVVPPEVALDPGPNPDMTIQRPYSLVSLVEKARFIPLDLSAQVNRPLNFRRGWLGDMPLKDLPAGRHTIHGVPFQVLGGSKHSDCGAIVFRSATNSTGNSKVLPESLSLPIRRKAKAVYVMHGCAYANFLQSFATYDFANEHGLIDSVPLVSLGQPPPEHTPRMFSESIARANIQDWWPDYPHVDFPHARMAPIAETDDAKAVVRYVYLYTLEWINPTPEIPLTELRITAEPDKATTIGVLAVTILTP